MGLRFTMFSEQPPWQKHYGLFCLQFFRMLLFFQYVGAGELLQNWGITTNSKDLGRSSAPKKGLNPHVPSFFPSLFHHGPFIFHHVPSIFPAFSLIFPAFSQHVLSFFHHFPIFSPLSDHAEAQAQHHACHGPPRTAATLMGWGFAGPLQGQVGHLHPVIVDLRSMFGGYEKNR